MKYITWNKLNYDAIAKAVVDGMTETQKSLIAFGMLDKQLLDGVEELLKSRYERTFEEIYGTSVDSMAPSAAEERKDFVRTSVREISKKIYAKAGERNMMVV